MLKAHGLDFAIIKGDQNLATDSHVFSAREAGLDVQLYFWHDPIQTSKTQIDWFMPDIEEHKPSAIWLDCEQSWANWTQFWANLRGEITSAQMLRVPPKAISDNALAVMQGLKKYTNIPIGIYTGQWFVNGYALPMAAWLDQYPLWLASYFDSNTVSYPATWDFINTTPPATFNPILSKRTWIPKTYQILQYSSRMIAPGQTSPYDWDIDIRGVAPAPAPLPAPTYPSYRLNAWTWVLRVRSGPGTNYPLVAGQLSDQYLTKLSSPVTAYAVQNGFIKISQVADRWCGLSGLSLVR